MLKIENLQNLHNAKVKTADAHWKVSYVLEEKNYYRVILEFNGGNNGSWGYPDFVTFTIFRYNEFESIKNEWKMQNDWNSNTITLTKGLLDIRMFPGILGGQLDKN